MNLQQVCTRGKCINFDPNNAVTSWQINNARCVIYEYVSLSAAQELPLFAWASVTDSQRSKKNCEQRLVTAGPDEGRDITGLKIDNDASSVRCS